MSLQWFYHLTDNFHSWDHLSDAFGWNRCNLLCSNVFFAPLENRYLKGFRYELVCTCTYRSRNATVKLASSMKRYFTLDAIIEFSLTFPSEKLKDGRRKGRRCLTMFGFDGISNFAKDFPLEIIGKRKLFVGKNMRSATGTRPLTN